MQLTAFLAESVVVADGRLFAHAAGWSVHHTDRLPAVVPRVGLGVIVDVGPDHVGKEVPLTVRLVDSAGRQQRLIGAAVEGGAGGTDVDQLAVSFQVDSDDDPVVVMAITMDNLALPEADRYRLVVSVDGCQVGVPLRVVPS